MQLRSARLCLDCDEVHDSAQCPACASESFAFITRWVPVPDRPDRADRPDRPDRADRADRPQKRARAIEPASAETLGAYRQMLRPEEQTGGKWRTVRRGAMGLAIFGIAGWLWRHNTRQPADAAQTTDETTQRN